MFDKNGFSSINVEGLDSLLSVYEELEAANTRQRNGYGFGCPEGCSICCSTSALNIEATVFELIPLALYLHGAGLTDHFYSVIKGRGFDSSCVMHSPGDQVFTGSGCSAYRWRPLVCRLFGYSAVSGRDGRARFSACRVMKERYPGIADRMNTLLEADCGIPVNSEVGMRVCQLNPALASKRYGINEALFRAIEFIGLRMRYAAESDNTLNDIPPILPDGERSA